MKQFLLAMGLGLSLTTVWAADDAIDAGSAVEATSETLQPAETPTNIDLPAATPVAGIETPSVQAEQAPDSEKLAALHQKLAAQKIQLFRTTIKNTEQKKNFLTRFLTSSQAPIDAELLSEMRHFIASQASLPETAEVYLLMSGVHQRIREYPAAAVDLLMLRAAFPGTAFDKEAVKRLKALADDELEKQADMLKDWGTKIVDLQGEREERMAGLLRHLEENTDPAWARPIAEASASFLAGNQSWLKEDLVEHAHARQAALLDAQMGVYHYDKLIALYPESPLHADSLLSKATIQRKSMRLFPDAATTYNQLITKFPDSAETKQAYADLAAMYDEDMQDYPNSIKTSEAIVAKYKNDTIVLNALRSMASIQQNKINQPAEAIESHLKIAELFKGDEGMEALLAAERLALFTTRDWAKAIDINHRIMALAPQHEEAFKAEFKNAEITEEKLGDKEAAKGLYAAFLDAHPDHDLSKEAARRIEAIDKAMNGSTR